MSVYFGSFSEWSDVQREFKMHESEQSKIVLYASYDIDDYEGSAVVLYFERECFYLVQNSHCSCYGLEGWNGDGWKPEPISLDVLIHVAERGNIFSEQPDLARILRNFQPGL